MTGVNQNRWAARQRAALEYHEPPRRTRSTPDEGPDGSVPPESESSYQSAHHSQTFPCMSYSPHAFGFFVPTGRVLLPLFPSYHATCSMVPPE